jgi:hypothetical protein
MERFEKALADMAEQNRKSNAEHNVRMAELDVRMLKFENGLEHLLEASAKNEDKMLRFENGLSLLLEVSAKNEGLLGKIGALVIQHNERIKRLEAE